MAHRSSPAEIADRRKQVSSLFLNRVMCMDIAQKLGVSKSTITQDIKALKNEWKADAQEDISLLIARELAELDRMELESAAQYQAAKKAGKDNIALRYADHRLDIKDRRAKLLGLDKPQKIDVNANVTHDIEGARELLESTIAGIASRIRTKEVLDQAEQPASDSSSI